MIEKINLQLAEFKDEEEKQKAIMDLTTGLTSPFWLWLEDLIQKNINLTQKELFDNEEMTKEENNLMKKHLRALKAIKNLPHKQISVLKGVDNENDNVENDPDPYDK